MIYKDIPEDKLQKIRDRVFKDSISFCFYTYLKKNRSQIHFEVNKTDLTITYYIDVCGEYLSLKTRVSEDIDLKLNSLNSSFNENKMKLSLLLYLIEEERELSEKELEEKYMPYYNSLKNFLHLSKEDLDSYLKAKDKFILLVDSLSFKDNHVPVRFKTICIRCDYDNIRSEEDLNIELEINSKVVQESFYDFYKQYQKTNTKYSRNNFSEKDKKFLDILQVAYKSSGLSTVSYVKSNRYLSYVFDVLQAYPRGHISYKERRIRIDNKTEDAKVYISSFYKIETDFNMKDILYMDNSMALCFNEINNTIYMKRFLNIHEYILLQFAFSEPSFPYQLYQDMISSMLIPAISKDIKVAENVLEKSRGYLTEINYYIIYENEEDESLKLKTEYILDGSFTDEDTFVTYDKKEEHTSFIKELLLLKLEKNIVIKDKQEIYRILSSDFSSLNKVCRLFFSDNLKRIKANSKLNFKVRVSSGIDWFKSDLFSDEYSKEEIESIIDHYRKKDKFIKLKDTIFNLEDEDNRFKLQIIDEFKIDKGESLPMYQALKLNVFLEKENVSLTDNIKDLFNSLKSYSKEDIKIDNHLVRTYQRDGIKWLYVLYKNNLSGLLADDMGLGKTLQVIEFLKMITLNKPILIVTPKAIIYNWKNEFLKWKWSNNVQIIEGKQTDRLNIYDTMKDSSTVYLISYETLRNDIDNLSSISFSYIILDEAHNIANAFAKKTVAVKNLKSDHRLALSGTPIQNSLLDIWSIFDFLLPDYLDDYSTFSKMYSTFDDDEEDKKKRLKLLVNPFILMRKKEDVLNDLPAKEEIDEYISLDEESRKIYSAYLYKAKDELTKKNKIQVLAYLTRLRQICVDPSSFIDDYSVLSSKLERVILMSKEAVLEGHKVLIFSSFVTVLNHLKEMFDLENIYTGVLTGKNTAEERLVLSDELNFGKMKILLASLKAGGTGLNLIGADIVFHLDPWWNVQIEKQATDRVYRIGQTKPVTIYKLIAKDTIEERVLLLQNMKKNIASYIDNEEEINYTDEDIRFILGE